MCKGWLEMKIFLPVEFIVYSNFQAVFAKNNTEIEQ
ncbi:MAG: hypothetical protein K0R65_1354 [Crocinitomicaceae bacterium]|jgi:hypothetical protein|nr:hypothetical protein [Crocinitomicaceae bacterium]